MRKKFSARAAALGMSGVLLTSALTGCTFGFASDPDDPNAVKEEVPIDMTTDTSSTIRRFPERVSSS